MLFHEVDVSLHEEELVLKNESDIPCIRAWIPPIYDKLRSTNSCNIAKHPTTKKTSSWLAASPSSLCSLRHSCNRGNAENWEYVQNRAGGMSLIFVLHAGRESIRIKAQFISNYHSIGPKIESPCLCQHPIRHTRQKNLLGRLKICRKRFVVPNVLILNSEGRPGKETSTDSHEELVT